MQKNRVGSHLHRCQLQADYIVNSAKITISPLFENGVIKKQDGRESELNRPEKRAASCLLRDRQANDDEEHNRECDPSMPLIVKLRKRRRMNHSSSYIECNSILGSVAEVERLFSKAK